MDILAIIPARGGSKGLARKNLQPLDKHPLVAWSIAAGTNAKLVTRVICSTDDPEIRDVALCYGCEVPFLRPVELAQDSTLDLPVFQHTLDWLEKHESYRPSIVVQLRPTSPLRPTSLVDSAVKRLLDNTLATSIRAVCPAPCTPYKMWIPPDGKSQVCMQPLMALPDTPEPYNQPRQQLPLVWWQIGTIDCIKADVIRGGSMSGHCILGYELPAQYVVDIDSKSDLHRAELTLSSISDLVHPSAILPPSACVTNTLR